METATIHSVRLFYFNIVNRFFVNFALFFCLLLFPLKNTAQVVFQFPTAGINRPLLYSFTNTSLNNSHFFIRETNLIEKKKNVKIISINGCVSIKKNTAFTALLDKKLNYIYKSVVIVVTIDGSISRMLQLKILL